MADSLLATFRMLARYNALANERLYAACARLGEGARKQPRRASTCVGCCVQTLSVRPKSY